MWRWRTMYEKPVPSADYISTSELHPISHSWGFLKQMETNAWSTFCYISGGWLFASCRRQTDKFVAQKEGTIQWFSIDYKPLTTNQSSLCVTKYKYPSPQRQKIWGSFQAFDNGIAYTNTNYHLLTTTTIIIKAHVYRCCCCVVVCAWVLFFM